MMASALGKSKTGKNHPPSRPDVHRKRRKTRVRQLSGLRLSIERLEERRLLTAELVSVTPGPLTLEAGSDFSTNPDVNASGRYVTFQSRADNLVDDVADTNATQDIFVRDLELGRTILISRNFEGTESARCEGLSECGTSLTAGSFNPAISDDGRFITFVSHSLDLVKDVTIDVTPNVFVHDRDADEDGVFDEMGSGETETTLLSIGVDGTAAGVVGGSGASTRPVISGDGSSVAFASFATDMLVDDTSIADTNGTGGDVYRASVETGTVSRINVDSTGLGTGSASGSVFDLSINGSGSVVAFATSNAGLVTAASGSVDDLNGAFDVFIGGGNAPVELVSIDNEGLGTGGGASREPSLSRDGRHVAFVSAAPDLDKGVTDSNGFEDVYVRDLKTERTVLVSRSRAVSSPVTAGDGASPPSTLLDSEITAGPVVSDDGRFVVYRSAASDLLDPTLGVVDDNMVADIFRYDRDPDGDGVFDEPGETVTELVSINTDGTASTGHASVVMGTSFAPSISDDGRYVAFASTGTDLVAGASGMNVYLRDMLTGVTALISETTGGSSGGPDGTSPPTRFAKVSRDGSTIVFQSETSAASLDPSVTDPPGGSAVPFGEFDVFAGVPNGDIVLTRNIARGFDEHVQAFRINNEDVPPFEVGYYRSSDRMFDPSDEFLESVLIDDLDDLSAGGNRFFTATIGTGTDEIGLPGIGSADPDEDYFILVVADPSDAVAEFDSDPFGEDNTRALRGIYHLPGGPVFIHGGIFDSGGVETIDVAVVGETLEVTSTSTTFGVPTTRTYDVADVTEIRIRTHEEDDTVTGSDLTEVVYAGEGSDFAFGNGGDDELFGGPGKDLLDGGEGADLLDGGPGPDILVGGPGDDILFDGPGDDLVDVGIGDDTVVATPGSDDFFITPGGIDTIDFTFADSAITLDLDSEAIQTVDEDLNTIKLSGEWENFIGSVFDDELTITPRPNPRRVGGGDGVDQLIVDAGGNVVIDDGTKLSFPNSALGDITYVDFENIRVINFLPLFIDDGDDLYSATGFTRQFDPQFPQGFNGDIEFSDPDDGDTATWTFSDLPHGSYLVSTTWTSAPDRGQNVGYSIFDGDASGSPVSEVRVNQEIAPTEFDDAGVSWQNLGLVTIGGSTLTVRLTDADASFGDDDPDSFVIADAIRIEPFDGVTILDDRDNLFSSSGNRVEGIGALGGSTSTATNITTSGGTWDCTQASCLSQLIEGRYLISATWPAGVSGAADDATFRVTSGANQFDANVNQLIPPNDFGQGGINWHSLGVIDIDPTVGLVVELTGDNGTLLADAIRLERAPGVEVKDPSGEIVVGGGNLTFAPTTLDEQTSIARARNRFTIRNDGDHDLIISDLTITGEGYSIPDSGASRIPPRGWTQIDVDFTADRLGDFGGTLAFGTNTFDNPIVTFDFVTPVILDDTPPTITIVSPDDGAELIEGTTIPIGVDVIDDTGISRVELVVDDQVVDTDLSEPFGFEFDTPITGQPQELSVFARAIDRAGNTTDSISQIISLIPDQPPTVQIVTPFDESGFVEGSTIPIQVDVNDDVRIQSVEILIDGNVVETLFDEPFISELQLPAGRGDHEITACAIDSGSQTTCHAVDVSTFVLPLIDLSSIVVAPGDATTGEAHPPVVRVLDGDGTETFRFIPYGESFAGGIRVATGDVTGDGIPDVVTAAGPGGGPHVKVFDGASGTELRSFFAFDPSFTGGVFVATGDVSGDGTDDIIVSAGPGGGPHVKVFNGIGGTEFASFFAFDSNFVGGVRVATGDLNGDGQDDLITGAGPGGGPHVRVFDGHTAGDLNLVDPPAPNSLLAEFLAYDSGFTGGVFVASGDVNGDGTADIITGPGAGGGPQVKLFDGKDTSELQSFFAFDPTFTGGVRVGAGDTNGDGLIDIVTGAGPSATSTVRVFDATTLQELGSPIPLPGSDGVFAAGAIRSEFSVAHLPGSGGTSVVETENDDIVVRDPEGNELFRQPISATGRLRVVGAPDVDDLLIVRTIGASGPIIVFDGGRRGFDSLSLQPGSELTDPLPFLRTHFESRLITNYSTSRDPNSETPPLKGVDLEPILDDLPVTEREFVFADTDDLVQFDTGADANDNILRIDSPNSEVVDFLQPSGGNNVHLGGGSDEFQFDLPLSVLASLDGGAGEDKVTLGGSGQHLDLTDPAGTRLRNVELIDLTASTDSQITLDDQSVVDVTEASNQLMLMHDNSASVHYVGGGWTVEAPIFRDNSQRHVLTNATARIETTNTLPWQNPFEPTDVNRSGMSTAGDALNVINLLGRSDSGEVILQTPTSEAELPEQYYDVDGSGTATALDALLVINFVARQLEGEGESALAIADVPRQSQVSPTTDTRLHDETLTDLAAPLKFAGTNQSRLSPSIESLIGEVMENEDSQVESVENDYAELVDHVLCGDCVATDF